MEIMWPLIVFTFFECVAGGTFAAQGLQTLRGEGVKTQFTSVLVALIALVIGGLGSFTHLQHWERVFNGFGHITSGITIEIIDCMVLGIALVVFFLMYRRADDGVAPKWCGIMALIIGLVFPVVIGMSYLMPSVPVWNTPLLPLYYLVNAAVMGTFANIIINEAKDAPEGREGRLKNALVVSAVFAVVVVVYAVYIALLDNGSAFSDIAYYFDPTLPDVGMVDASTYTVGLLAGSLAPAFWIGVVIVGCVAPIAGAWFARKQTEAKKVIAVAGACLACSVVGGVIWRVLLYIIAIHAFPLY